MSILGSTLFEVSIQLDSRDSGVVVERPVERFVSLYDAQSWVKQELQAAEVEGCGEVLRTTDQGCSMSGAGVLVLF